jgi:hypothetical protein
MCRAGLTGVPIRRSRRQRKPSLPRPGVWQLRCKCGSLRKLSNADHLSGMSRRHFGRATLATAAGIVLAESAARSAPAQASNVVLVHGAFADGSSCVTLRDIQPVSVRLFSGWFLSLSASFPLFPDPLRTVSLSRIRFAAPNAGAPLTAPGRPGTHPEMRGKEDGGPVSQAGHAGSSPVSRSIEFNRLDEFLHFHWRRYCINASDVSY